MSKLRILGGVAIAALGLTLSAPASAGTGCNGVVNVFVWGCAPWDNNNGSQFPYYQKKQVTVPKRGSQIVDKNGQRMVLYNGQYFPLVGNDGASMIGNDVGGFRVWSPQ